MAPLLIKSKAPLVFKIENTHGKTNQNKTGQIGHPDLIKYRPHVTPEAIRLAPAVTCIFGMSLANCHVIEAENELIVIDSGHSGDEGAKLRQLIRQQVSQKPIAALLYTHSHYTRGSRQLLAGDAAAIIGHPRLHKNKEHQQHYGPGAQRRRSRLERGTQLPQTGPNAVIAPAPATGALQGYLPPTQTAVPGDRLELAGIPIDILPGDFDTDDGLSFSFPTFDVVAQNLVVSQMPNFGSLGGGRYRNPVPWLAAVQELLTQPPEYLLPCHGRPLVGRQAISHRLRVNHQAVEYLYQAVMQGLAAGATIPDLVRDIDLPSQLKNDPDLRQLYGSISHLVSSFAQGETGFWSGEPRDLVPLHRMKKRANFATWLGVPNNSCNKPNQLRTAALKKTSPMPPGPCTSRTLPCALKSPALDPYAAKFLNTSASAAVLGPSATPSFL